MATLSKCSICGVQLVDSKTQICSKECSESIEILEKSLIKQITDHKNTEDNRIFFYDIGLGQLIDIYTILLIRYIHQNEVDRYETDFQLGKIRDGVLSKINRSARYPEMKKHIAKLTKDIFHVNFKMWRNRNRVQDRKLPDIERQKCALEYFDSSYDRDLIRQLADASIDGRAKTVRIYGK